MKMHDVNTLKPLNPGEPGYDIADAASVAVELPRVNDWSGVSIPEPGPDEIVKVWSIDCHRDPSYTDCVIMCWQDMLTEFQMIAEQKLENMDLDDLKEGFGLKVKLTEMRYADYEALSM